MQSLRQSYARGIALVELSGILLVMLPLILAGVVIGDYVQAVSRVNEAVHTRIVDGMFGNTTTPTHVSPAFGLGVNGQASLRNAELNQLIATLRDALVNDLSGQLFGATAQDLFVEVGWVTLPVNQTTGEVNSTNPQIVSVVTGGALSVSPPRTMVQEFQLFAQATIAAEVPGQPSSLATALPRISASGTDPYGFLPMSVLLGARVSARSGNGLIRDTLSGLGIQTVIRDFRAVHLRGDVR